MARAPDVIVDDSPIDDPRINVPLRVGWLLRTCRLNSRVEPGLSGHRFAASLGVGAAMITKWEKGSDDVDAAGVAGYERLVDLPAGSLRGLVDTTRRYFRHPVGPRLAADPISADIDEVSEAVRPAMAGTPSGLDWLHLADALAENGPLRLPDFVVAPVVHGLVDELSRSVRGAFLSRFEALARLRTGPYSDIVLDVVRDRALAEDTQASAAALIAAAQLPNAALFVEMTRLLVDAREGVHHGAAHSLVTMAAVGGIAKDEMRDAVPAVVEAYNSTADDPARHALLSGMLRNLPRGVLEAARPQLVRPLHPVPDIQRGTARDRLAPAVAREVALAVKAQLPAPEDHVLERVVLEAMFDPRWAKAHVAGLFLSVLPYADLVAQELARLADTSDHPDVRESAALLVLRLSHPSTHDTVEQWSADGDRRLQRAALVTLGRVSDEVDQALLRKLAGEDWSVARLAVYAAGMTRSHLLHEWIEEPATPAAVRRGAAWWRRHGGRIDD